MPKSYFRTYGKITALIGLFYVVLIGYERTLTPIEIPHSITGELWTKDQIILEEKNIYLRKWKGELYQSQYEEINAYRKTQNLPPLQTEIIESFSPTKLSQELIQNPENYHLVDVREAYEISKLSISGAQMISFGELVHSNSVKLNNEKTQKIIVLCYSGIRGYYAAIMLKDQGYKNIAVIRGGLGRWKEENIPGININGEFKFAKDLYPKVKRSEIPQYHVINFSQNPQYGPTIFYEFLTNNQKQEILKAITAQEKPPIVICQTESECFHISNLGYYLEKNQAPLVGFFRL